MINTVIETVTADSEAQLLNQPRRDSLLGPTLLRRTSSLTDSVLGRNTRDPLLDSLTPLLDPLSHYNSNSIMAILKSSPQFSVLVKALTITDLASSLEVFH